MQAELAAVMLYRHGVNFDQEDIRQEQAAARKEVQAVVKGYEEQIVALADDAYNQIDVAANEFEAVNYVEDAAKHLECLTLQVKTRKDIQVALVAITQAQTEELQARRQERRALGQNTEVLHRQFRQGRQVPEEAKINAIGERAVMHTAGLPQMGRPVSEEALRLMLLEKNL